MKIEFENHTEWRNEKGQLHREDGPAVIMPFTKKWYKNGELHREDGPAIVSDYFKKWYRNGQLHREDGPAVEEDRGCITGMHLEWWINGKQTAVEDYGRRTNLN